jgi:hypothetical protein
MKTHFNLLKPMTRTIFLGLIIIACSCKENSAQKKESTASESKVKPPQIDIHTAVVTDNLDALKQHIAAGSNINEKDPFGGSSPLISAAVFGKTEAARLLIDAGADVNFQNKEGSTALHTSAFFCRPDILKMLLKKGADKTIKNNYGSTALQSVTGPFSESKPFYDMMVQALGPMGLKLDYVYVEKTRPQIADLLK